MVRSFIEINKEFLSIPVVPLGAIILSMAISPWRTLVNALFSSSVGVPKCYKEYSDNLNDFLVERFPTYESSGYIGSAIRELS